MQRDGTLSTASRICRHPQPARGARNRVHSENRRRTIGYYFANRAELVSYSRFGA
jgi:hypothetical protein